MKFLRCALVILLIGCGQVTVSNPGPELPDAQSSGHPDPGSNAGPETEPPPPEASEFPHFAFEEAGDELGAELIDLQQLPDGRWLVISRAGELHLLSEDFHRIASAALDGVDAADDFGLQNLELAPDFARSGELYVYFTPGFPDPSPPCDLVRCARLERLNVELEDKIEIEHREKLFDVPAVSTNMSHNGGGMVFLGDDLFLATGDGGTSTLVPDAPQDDDSLLGKLLRVRPSGEVEIYAKGLRNPFTMTAGNGGLLIANVGAKSFEEIDFAEAPGLNFGWPLNEGPTDAPGMTGPIHGYGYDDTAFIDQDPDGEPVGGKSIIAGVFYSGAGYDGALTRSLLYNEFFAGWVRALQFDASGNIVQDRHVAHYSWITAMKTGRDGIIYAVSLYGSPKVLRLRML